MEKQEYFKYVTKDGLQVHDNPIFRNHTPPGIKFSTLNSALLDVKELQGKMMQLEAQNEKLKLRLDKLEEKFESSDIKIDGSSLSLIANRRDI